MSIVAVGGDVEAERVVGGAKADPSTEAILFASQVVFMSSGKSGESRMKTSEGERRPRIVALCRSSVRRVGPREFALPVFGLLVMR